MKYFADKGLYLINNNTVSYLCFKTGCLYFLRKIVWISREYLKDGRYGNNLKILVLKEHSQA